MYLTEIEYKVIKQNEQAQWQVQW